MNLGEEFDGQARIIQVNIDRDRAAANKYGVRATPTFVLFDADGQVRGQAPGWPGYQAFQGAFQQLLSGT